MNEMWQRDYITNADYELAFPAPDHKDVYFYECKHCGSYMIGEDNIIEHLNEKHWWLRDAEVIIIP